MELEQLQNIVNTACSFNRDYLPYPIVELKNVKGAGSYRSKSNKITLPIWILKYSDIFQIYYAIHETCHYRVKSGHGPLFREFEIKILKHFGMVPVYKGVYAKRLTDLTGVVSLWEESNVEPMPTRGKGAGVVSEETSLSNPTDIPST